MLEVRNLSVSYGQHRSLDAASAKVGKGEIVVILGANGAGKSTLLKAVSGICEGKVSGSVSLDGDDLSGLPAHKIVEAGIALVPEGRGVFGDLTVHENLSLGAYSDRARDDEGGNLDRVYRLFPKLLERKRQVVRTMSGGEQQMVAIGRAMMSNPTILTLDEPSLGLSPLLTKELFLSLKAVRSAGIGILLVEQNAKQSLAIADRGYLLENGEIVYEDKASNLMNDPAVQAAYLGSGGGKIAPHTVHAAPHTGPAPKAQPQPSKSPEPASTPAPRPVGTNPGDIAASALQQFTQRTSSPPVATSPRAPSQPAATVSKPAPPPTPAAPPLTTPAPANGATAPFGLQIGDLVARAAEQSSNRPKIMGANGKAPGTPPPAASPSARTVATKPLKMPDLADSHDRLKSILTEIEEAAARARGYRPQDKT